MKDKNCSSFPGPSIKWISWLRPPPEGKSVASLIIELQIQKLPTVDSIVRIPLCRFYRVCGFHCADLDFICVVGY